MKYTCKIHQKIPNTIPSLLILNLKATNNILWNWFAWIMLRMVIIEDV